MEGHWELIEGDLLPTFSMLPVPTPEHARCARQLSMAFARAMASRGDPDGPGDLEACEVFQGPLNVRLSEDDIVQPDLVVVCHPAQVTEEDIEGPPDLVVEILSPRTREKDWKDKRAFYARWRIPEYLLVEPEPREAFLLRLKGGRYVRAARVRQGGALPLLGGRLPLILP